MLGNHCVLVVLSVALCVAHASQMYNICVYAVAKRSCLRRLRCLPAALTALHAVHTKKQKKQRVWEVFTMCVVSLLNLSRRRCS